MIRRGVGRSAAALGAAVGLLAGVGDVGAAALARHSAAAQAPVLVELYTAQGCAACPQANALLQELAGRRGVVALSFPVDLWDYLGWADTLARPEFTARQRAYVARFKLREIYTPEIVVDGRREALGFERERVQGLIEAARREADARASPRRLLALRGSRVRLGAARRRADMSDVWLVRYDPSERTVKVTAGENKGKTVVEQNVVRELVRLGGWSGRSRTFALPPSKADGLTTLVLLQAPRGGAIKALAIG